MQATTRSSYRLKRFRTSDDPDFAAALLLYVRNTSAEIRTDSAEITFWLDEFERRFGDPFYVFGFFRDRELVGYAEAAYLHEERILSLDYLAIDQAHRRNNVFYEFVDHLKRFLETEHPEYRYAVTEVCYGIGQTAPSQQSSLMTRLLKMQGFHVVRAEYFQPRLNLKDVETEMRSDLLLYSEAPVATIHSQTYLMIVEALYYKYYLPWKSTRPQEYEEYKRYIDKLFDRIQKRMRQTKVVAVNGHTLVLATPEKQPTAEIHSILGFAWKAIAIVVSLTAAMLGLKTAFHLSDSYFLLVYGIAVLSFFASAGIVSKDARTLFREIVSLMKFFSRKTLSDLKPNGKSTEVDVPHGQNGP